LLEVIGVQLFIFDTKDVRLVGLANAIHLTVLMLQLFFFSLDGVFSVFSVLLAGRLHRRRYRKRGQQGQILRLTARRLVFF
jgi:hypothetical protein